MGTQVVTVVEVGLVNVTVVQISVPTQASAVPHPVAAVLVRREAWSASGSGRYRKITEEVTGHTRHCEMRSEDD